MLREYWVTHRNPVWMFPSEGRDHIELKKATEPLHKSGVQDAFRAALKETKINKTASVHTLRHYAEFPTMPSRIVVTGGRRTCLKRE